MARSADLREALTQRLEQISSYHYLRVAEAATANRNPTISAFRLLDLRGTKYCVLTRIQPCGLDFTARTNHLAHHLVFAPEELAQLPTPAAILRHWPGWMAAWQGEPRFLEGTAPADFAAAARSFLPAQTWLRMTGDAGRAAGLLETECIRGCYLVCPPGGEAQVLDLFCETLELLNPNGQYPLRPWRHPFTTFLQAEDNPADFQWRACQEGTPACQQAVQRACPSPAFGLRACAGQLARQAGARRAENTRAVPSGGHPAGLAGQQNAAATAHHKARPPAGRLPALVPVESDRDQSRHSAACFHDAAMVLQKVCGFARRHGHICRRAAGLDGDEILGIKTSSRARRRPDGPFDGRPARAGAWRREPGRHPCWIAHRTHAGCGAGRTAGSKTTGLAIGRRPHFRDIRFQFHTL